jgi:dienelactone hydrolase
MSHTTVFDLGRRTYAGLMVFVSILVLAGAPAGAQTDELVSFTGHTPHTRSAGVALQARLVRPAGSGPFPAVVVLHGSAGMWTTAPDPAVPGDLGNMRDQFDRWAGLLVANGYVALVLDSFSGRAAQHPGGFQNLQPPADADVAPVYERSRDAFDALAYLRGLSYVDDGRIAVLGFSHGAGGVVGAMVDAAAANDPDVGIGSGNFEVSANGNGPYTVPDPAYPPGGQGFRCGVGYYPGAAFFGYFGKATDPQDGFYRPTDPLLLIYGESDPFWTSGHPANLQTKAGLSGSSVAGGNPLLLESHAGLAHSFDNGDTDEIRAIRGRVLELFDSCVPRAETREHFGDALAVGDFNCDGADDLAIGAPDRDVRGRLDAGAVEVVFGDHDDDHLPAASTWRLVLANRGPLEAVVAGAEFGRELAAGDFDGDGCDDLAVGAPGDRSTEGQVHVFYGQGAGDALPPLDSASRDLVHRDLAEVPGSGAVGQRFGDHLAAGDLDGDLVDDLAIAVPGDSGIQGAVAVVYGGSAGITSWARPARVLTQSDLGESGGRETGDGYDLRVAIADFDGDGFGDLVAAFPKEDRVAADDGWLAVARGSATGVTTAGVLGFDQTSLTGTNPEIRDYFGATLAAGDLDGDGYDDLVVASPGEDWNTTVNVGVVHLVYGSSSGLTFSGNRYFLSSHWGPLQTDGWFGAGLTIFRDQFFEPTANLAIGATNVTVGAVAGAGRVYLAYGTGGRKFKTQPQPGDEIVPLYALDRSVLDGAVEAGGFGSSLAAGDLDDNGLEDVIAGARWDRIGGRTEAGSVSLVSNDEEARVYGTDVLLRQD